MHHTTSRGARGSADRMNRRPGPPAVLLTGLPLGTVVADVVTARLLGPRAQRAVVVPAALLAEYFVDDLAGTATLGLAAEAAVERHPRFGSFARAPRSPAPAPDSLVRPQPAQARSSQMDSPTSRSRDSARTEHERCPQADRQTKIRSAPARAGDLGQRARVCHSACEPVRSRSSPSRPGWSSC